MLIHASSADQAADLGDFLAVHGYGSGPPGDETAPLWLSPGEDEAAREALDAMATPATVATLSFSVPPGAAAATLRHTAGGPAWALAAVRETGHLKEVAAAAGLRLKRVRPTRPPRVSATLDARVDELHEAVRAPEMASYYLLVESLLDRFSTAEIAAAALLLLDRGSARKATASVGAAHASAPESWTRLFVSAGKRDDLGPGDLLGALTNQSGVPGRRVGRIDVRESHSLIEVRESDAKKVISAMNGITLGGRSLRVDYDRAKERRPGGRERQAGGRQGHPGRKPRQGGGGTRRPGRRDRSPGGRKPGRPGGKGWPRGGKPAGPREK